MLRGPSILVGLSRRNFKILRKTGGSSCSVHGQPRHKLNRVGHGPSGPPTKELFDSFGHANSAVSSLSEINVLQVVNVLQNCLPRLNRSSCGQSAEPAVPVF